MRYRTVLLKLTTTDIHEASRGLSATAELLVVYCIQQQDHIDRPQCDNAKDVEDTIFSKNQTNGSVKVVLALRCTVVSDASVVLTYDRCIMN